MNKISNFCKKNTNNKEINKTNSATYLENRCSYGTKSTNVLYNETMWFLKHFKVKQAIINKKGVGGVLNKKTNL